MYHMALIPQDNSVTADLAGMVRIKAEDGKGQSLSLMLFTDQARALRDALNAMNLAPCPSCRPGEFQGEGECMCGEPDNTGL